MSENKGRNTELMIEVLKGISENGQKAEETLSKYHPADLADGLEAAEAADRVALIRGMGGDHLASLLPYVGKAVAEEVVRVLTDAELAEVVEELAADDAVDLLQSLSIKRRQSVLAKSTTGRRAVLRPLLMAEPDSAASVMTTEFFGSHQEATVGEAFDAIRAVAQDVETPYVIYVVEKERLVGTVSLRDLLGAEDSDSLKSLMNTSPVTVKPDLDREEVARTLARYNLLSIPVVDADGKILGVVTHDDILDVTIAEATEDILKGAGISFAEVEVNRSMAILDSGIPRVLKLRLPWLFLALLGGLMAGGVIEVFEDTLDAIVALAFFVPVIMDMGGNVGTQASTIFVRGLALGHIDDKNAFRHFGREGLVGMIIGLIIGTIGGVGAYLWQGALRGEEFAGALAIVVFVGLVVVCVVASVVGYVIPWVMHKLGFDPAAASDPLITTVKDVTALVIYFGLASWLLSELIAAA